MITLTDEEFKKRYGEVGLAKFDTLQNSKPQEKGFFNRVTSDYSKAGQDIVNGIKSGADQITQGNPFGAVRAGLRTVGGVAKAAFAPVTEAPVVKPTLEAIGTGVSKIPGFDTVTSKLTELSRKYPEISKDIQNIIDIATLGGGKAVEKPIAEGVTKTVTNASKTIGKAIDNVTTPITDKLNSTIEDFGQKLISPDVPQTTRVSLNPKVALKDANQDITVSVGGKLKKLSEITPTENMKMQASTEKSLSSFTKQAEKFKNSRETPGGSPLEIVGSRTDNAVNFANKKRQVVGAKMGEIEQKYVNTPLPISDSTLNTFADTLKSIDNPKFGINDAEAPVVKKLVQDFDNLEKGGATIGERLDFVRSWDKYLNDAKDAFGNFKENASVNTRIQNAVKTLKNETVDHISKVDKTYRKLRTTYAEYKRLQEFANQLLGKDGALGEKIKGAATVKRAIQSNSDAGARQFLIKLKEITGYDAIKEGDIAITAMENVGDYQGLSLLELLKEGKRGVLQKAVEVGQNLLVGDKASRVNKFIKKR